MEDTTFWLELLKHPILFVLTMVMGLIFVGMTYNFILSMFGKKTPFDSISPKDGGEWEPPETSNVPSSTTPPDDTLKGAEEIPDGAEEVENGDGTTTVEYTYDEDEPWWSKKHWYAGDGLSPYCVSGGDDETKATSAATKDEESEH